MMKQTVLNINHRQEYQIVEREVKEVKMRGRVIGTQFSQYQNYPNYEGYLTKANNQRNLAKMKSEKEEKF